MLKSNLSSTLMDAIFFSKLSLGLLPWLFLLTYSWHDTDPPGHRSFLLFLLIAVCPRHCHFPRQGHHCHCFHRCRHHCQLFRTAVSSTTTAATASVCICWLGGTSRGWQRMGALDAMVMQSMVGEGIFPPKAYSRQYFGKQDLIIGRREELSVYLCIQKEVGKTDRTKTVHPKKRWAKQITQKDNKIHKTQPRKMLFACFLPN